MGLLAVLDYVEAVIDGKFSGGVPDLAFDEQNLMNVLVSAQDCVRSHLARGAI